MRRIIEDANLIGSDTTSGGSDLGETLELSFQQAKEEVEKDAAMGANQGLSQE